MSSFKSLHILFMVNPFRNYIDLIPTASRSKSRSHPHIVMPLAPPIIMLLSSISHQHSHPRPMDRRPPWEQLRVANDTLVEL
jgi:hypothetical protein